jgi:hypothetical protein
MTRLQFIALFILLTVPRESAVWYAGVALGFVEIVCTHIAEMIQRYDRIKADKAAKSREEKP